MGLVILGGPLTVGTLLRMPAPWIITVASPASPCCSPCTSGNPVCPGTSHAHADP